MIQGCISSKAFAAGASAVELADAVAAAGLNAVELDLGEQGELGLDGQDQLRAGQCGHHHR